MEAGMPDMLAKTRRLMELSGIAEMPFGLVYAKERPEGFGPKDGELLNRDREEQGLVDWKKMRETFSCLVCKLWLARKKRTAAWISRELCGCMGGGYYTGLYSPWMRTIEAYVSTGNPAMGMEGERYMPSPASTATQSARAHSLSRQNSPSISRRDQNRATRNQISPISRISLYFVPDPNSADFSSAP